VREKRRDRRKIQRGKMSKQTSSHALVLGLGVAAIASLILYQIYSNSDDDGRAKARAEEKARGLPQAPPTKGSNSSSSVKSAPSEAATPLVDNTTGRGEKGLHLKIEELDKKGKALFKDKKYLEAADAFTEALDLIANHGGSKESVSLARQVTTLTNNRSAMYEKGGLADLALMDCTFILEHDVGHNKARTRTLRILESQERYSEALVQICALQLKFMQENRAQLRMGVPLQPPVPQQKLEEVIAKLIPSEVEKNMAIASQKVDRPLPSQYTLTQLLKSFSGYNAWMAKAARDGTVSTLTTSLLAETDPARKASLFLKRGLRHVHDKSYQKAVLDFEAGHALVQDDPVLQDAMQEDDYARLLEWVGMVRHWKYDLDGALLAYAKCSELEPTNVSVRLEGVMFLNIVHKI
jgi:tetratricopeptide (TPR) repeat protein